MDDKNTDFVELNEDVSQRITETDGPARIKFMKRCPECGREYDNTMMFCLDDGAELLYGPAKSEPPASEGGQFVDEPQTAILHSTDAPGEAPTRAQINTTDQTAILHTGAEAEPQSKLGDSTERSCRL